MKERPILFSASMVRAILEGRKTQTRRVVKDAPTGNESYLLGVYEGVWGIHANVDAPTAFRARCPYGQPGDRLWVRETWSETDRPDGTPVATYAAGGCIAVGRGNRHTSDFLIPGLAWPGTPKPDHWHPSIHMPRWASRITLEITDVRVQRVHDISEADAIAEGCSTGRFATDVPSRAAPLMGPDCYRAGFACLWDSINAKRGFGWSANPWVWALTFKRVEQPA